MDVLELAKLIERLRSELDGIKSKMHELSKKTARFESDYEKALAITIVTLQSGESVEFEGKTITKPPATIVEKIAKGVCYEEALKKNTAVRLLRALEKEQDNIQTQISALQSINKHLDQL